MTIKLVTLKTNHTLLAKTEEFDDYVELKNPIHVINVPPRENGAAPGVALSAFLEYSEEFVTGIKISKDSILCINTPIIDLENKYNSMFGSGIQIAQASSVPPPSFPLPGGGPKPGII